ncbi:NAD(P)-binding domain-containing protein [Demequina sp. NBRC 110056]|uniref:NAD(P)-binding domain-containing protein n=1 Tax=Demequina sp. NBRC 110056 TaxID=1570345 RepID=UPI0009FE2CD1|nr:NAD(P)-binding domain-containing protein [Demequina sp. NBRC 110056]
MTSNAFPELPIAVIGAGPVGLAAAAHLLERGRTPLVLESGAQAGAAILEWAHVPLFSPWRYTVDVASRRLLEAEGWMEPDLESIPTGGDLVREYLAPLAAHRGLAPHIRYAARVIGVARRDMDKVRSVGRGRRPLVVRVQSDSGVEDIEVAGVIDASGTWRTPNPVGAGGLPAQGEEGAAHWLAGPLPDVLGRDREAHAGRATLVIGMGHSAANTLLALDELASGSPGTEIVWAIRGRSPRRLYGGAESDELPARGAIGTRLREAVDAGRIRLVTDFSVSRLEPTDDGRLAVHGARDGQVLVVDRLAAATGFRPDLDMLREVRLDLDPALECPRALGPLIDPTVHSCSTVEPHGADLLAHPESEVYVVGMKSYGRAPTFLLATGYEQVRSVVAAMTGDAASAARVDLLLPATGVCCATAGAGGC